MINRKAKLLMTKRELELVESGASENVKFHSPKDLRQNIKIARKLRDKYRDLNRRQRVAQKPSENTRTVEKENIFTSVLQRFEMQYEGALGPS